MNDHTMYDAVSGIDEKYLAASVDGEAVKATIRSARRKRRVVLLSACACVILLVCAVGPIRHYLNHMPGKEPTPIVEPGPPDPLSIAPDPGWRSSYISLIKADSLNYHGIYYSDVFREDGPRAQKYAVFEATVDEDFYPVDEDFYHRYHNLEHGETIYIKFPVTSFWTDGPFDPDPFIQGLQACDSLILYVEGLDDYVYPNERCDPEERITLGKTFRSYYYTTGFIPIRDSRVDFSFMQDALVKSGYEGYPLSRIFEDIDYWGGVSITQGDSLEEARNVILQMIDRGIYGLRPRP